MKVGCVSLGCAKNLIDTEVMLGLLRQDGFDLTTEPGDADVLLVNTCAFIESAKEESITTILGLADYKRSGHCRTLIVAGCLGQRYGQELLDEMPEVNAIVGTGAFRRIAEAVRESLAGNRVVLIGDNDTIYDAATPRILTSPSYSAFVKIAEGCDNGCSFCAIPLVRGRYRSRPAGDIVAEAQRLALAGVRELNLVAQDTTNYGRDLYGAPSLARLLRDLCRIDGLRWIRTLYCYPRFFSDELIDTIAGEPKLCHYVDLPLQHVHDAVLRRMNRCDTHDSIDTLLQKLRSRIPDVAIRATFIVGFPGETDANYQALRQFIERQRFDNLGLFTYSREEGTAAYDMAGQVSEDVIQERYHDLMSLQCKISEQLNRAREGQVADVLVEGRDEENPNIAYGRTFREAPEVDGQVYIENDTTSRPGDLVRVRIDQGYTYDIVGHLV